MLLLNAIGDLKGDYNLVVGHNYGAMYPAVMAAKKFGCKCGFDMEDYHPGEGHDVGFQPVSYTHLDVYKRQKEMFPVAAKWQDEILSVPMFSELTASQVQFVADNLNNFSS